MNSQESCSRVLKLMGNRFELTVNAENKAIGDYAIDQTITEDKRIEE